MNKTLYTPCKTRSLKVKQFIDEFDFANPRWDSLHEGFPHCDTRGLTKTDKHLYGAILTVWTVSESGRNLFYKKIARRAAVGFAIVIITVLLGTDLLSGTQNQVTKTVSAKTIGQAVEEAVQATMSAVFRK